MKFDDNNQALNTQLQTLGIDKTFYAYNYFLSYTRALVSRFSNNYELPGHFQCFLGNEYSLAPSVEHALHGRLATHALAALLLARANQTTPFIDAVKLLVLNAALKNEMAYSSQNIHFLRTFLEKNWDHHSDVKSGASYSNCFDHLKRNVDILFERQEIKNFINRLLDVYFATPFKEKNELEKNRSKRDEQIQRTRYTSTSIQTKTESRELAKTLDLNLENKNAPISALLIISRLFSISVEEAYHLLARNFKNIKLNGSISKSLQNPKSIANKTYYEASHDNVNLGLPTLLVVYLNKLDEMFEKPSDTLVMSFIEKIKRKSKSLERINLSLIKSSSIQEFNLRNKNSILSYVIFNNEDECHPLEAHYNYVDDSDLALYVEHIKHCCFEIESKRPSGFIYGCQLKQEIVDSFYQNLHEYMENEYEDVFIIFNKRVIYRLHAIYLATGARPTIDPFSEWSDLSLNYRILKITDKQVESNPFRYIPFPAMIEEYLQQHKRDLKKIAAAIYRKDRSRKEFSRAILDLSEGKNTTQLPLFFLLDENLKAVSVRGKDLINRFDISLPANFPRKLFASFMSRTVSLNTSQALLGHTYSHIPYLGQVSLNAQNHAQQIRNNSNALLEHYGFKSLPELGSYHSKELSEINNRKSRVPKLEIIELSKIVRVDEKRKKVIRDRNKLVAELAKKYRRGEISEYDIKNSANENGLSAEVISQRVMRRIDKIKRSHIRHDYYRGGSRLIVRSERLKSIYTIFSELLDDIDRYSNVELSNYFRLSLYINRRITSEKIADAIVKAINKGEFSERKIYIELYGRHQSVLVLDKFSYFIALKILKSGQRIKKSDALFQGYIYKHFRIKSLKALKEVVNSANEIQLDSLHADFLAGKVKNATTAMKLLENDKPDVEKIKAITKRKTLPGQLAAVIRKSSKVNIKVLQYRVETLLNQSNLTESDELISKWGLNLIEKGLKFSTVISYLRIISRIIIQSDASEILTMNYLKRQEGLIKHFKNINETKNGDYDLQRFIDFYEFTNCHYDLYIDIEEISEEVDVGEVFINNLIITESEYLMLIKSIANDITLIALFILFYRFGSRTREIAYLLVADLLKDGNFYILSIKKNEYRDLKTDKSRRLAYQLEELSEFEEKILKKFVSERLLSSSTNLLFAFENSSEIETLINRANSVLQSTFQTQYLTLYSFRHTYCSRVTESIYSNNHASLTHYLTALDDLDTRYSFLSQNLGHASIITTFENYDHASTVYFQRQIDELIDKELSQLSYKRLERLTGISACALRKKSQRNKDFIRTLAVIDEQNESVLVFNRNKLFETASKNEKSRLSLKNLNRFLSIYIDEIELSAEIFNLSVKQLQDYLQAAQKIVTTTKLDPYSLQERLGNHNPIKDLPKMARVINSILTRAENLPVDFEIVADALIQANFSFRKLILPARQADRFIESVSKIFQSNKLISCSRMNSFQFEIKFETENHPDISVHIIYRILFLVMVRAELRGNHD